MNVNLCPFNLVERAVLLFGCAVRAPHKVGERVERSQQYFVGLGNEVVLFSYLVVKDSLVAVKVILRLERIAACDSVVVGIIVIDASVRVVDAVAILVECGGNEEILKNFALGVAGEEESVGAVDFVPMSDALFVWAKRWISKNI